MQPTVKHANTEWKQIDGDITASEYGVKFGQWDYGYFHIVSVSFMPDGDDSFDGDLPYSVMEFEFDESDIGTDHHRAALSSIGLSRDTPVSEEMPLEAHFIAMFDYGRKDPRQPSTWFDEYGEMVPSLKWAMDDYGISASALWRPEEYDKPVPDYEGHVSEF